MGSHVLRLEWHFVHSVSGCGSVFKFPVSKRGHRLSLLLPSLLFEWNGVHLGTAQRIRLVLGLDWNQISMSFGGGFFSGYSDPASYDSEACYLVHQVKKYCIVKCRPFEYTFFLMLQDLSLNK